MGAAVLLHGWGMNAAVFDELAQGLSPRCEVLAATHRYGGLHAGTPCDIDDVVEDIAACAPRKCSVVGWSLGAQVALAWARARPGQIERLVLMAATPCFVQRDDWPCAMQRSVFDAFGAALAGDAAGTLERFVSLQGQGDDAQRRVTRVLRAALSRAPPPLAGALENGLALLRETDLRGRLGAINARTLVVHGERDELVPLAAAEYLANALPHARLAVVRGAAHAPFVSDPARVSAVILELFDER